MGEELSNPIPSGRTSMQALHTRPPFRTQDKPNYTGIAFPQTNHPDTLDMKKHYRILSVQTNSPNVSVGTSLPAWVFHCKAGGNPAPTYERDITYRISCFWMPASPEQPAPAPLRPFRAQGRRRARPGFMRRKAREFCEYSILVPLLYKCNKTSRNSLVLQLFGNVVGFE